MLSNDGIEKVGATPNKTQVDLLFLKSGFNKKYIYTKGNAEHFDLTLPPES